MALTKVDYIDHTTVITAANLNAIQDEIIQKCVTVETKSFTAAQKKQARANISAAPGVLAVSSSNVSSLPKTISNSAITDDMVVVNSVLSNPSAQTNDWTVTTAAGSVEISGSISGTTNITLYLAQGQ